MPALPFGLGAYSRANDRLPRVRLINLFAEATPTAEHGVALLQRPGLVAVREQVGPARGFYRQDGVFAGDLFSVFGLLVYREGASIGAVTGDDLVEWAYGAEGLHLLADGDVWLVGESSITKESIPDDAEIASITSIDGILVAVRRDDGRIYFKLSNDTTWGALDYFYGDREPDLTIAVRRVGDELWAFGSSSIEVFAPTGDATVPFSRIAGRAVLRGARSRDAIALLDNSVFWIGEDHKAYRGDNIPTRISDFGVEERVQKSAHVSAWTYSLSGHTFYVVNLDSETLAYDVATGQWHQLKIYGSQTFVTTGLFIGSLTYVGLTGGTYLLDDGAAHDDGQKIERILTAVAATEAPVSAHCVEAQISPGTSPLGKASVMEMRWSDDQARTWTDWRATSLGTEGAYRTRARWRRLGMIDGPGRVFEFRVTDPAIIRVSGVSLNPPLGGRAR